MATRLDLRLVPSLSTNNKTMKVRARMALTLILAVRAREQAIMYNAQTSICSNATASEITAGPGKITITPSACSAYKASAVL